MNELTAKIQEVLNQILLNSDKFIFIPPLNKDETDGIILHINDAIIEEIKMDNNYKSKCREFLHTLKNSKHERDQLKYKLIKRLAKEFNVEPQIK